LASEAGGKPAACRFSHGAGIFSLTAQNPAAAVDATLAGADQLI